MLLKNLHVRCRGDAASACARGAARCNLLEEDAKAVVALALGRRRADLWRHGDAEFRELADFTCAQAHVGLASTGAVTQRARGEAGRGGRYS